MRKITIEELNTILENHKHWLNRDCEGWENMKADLSNTDLSGANLSNADMRFTNLRLANLSGADMSNTDMSNTDLSGAVGLKNPIDYIKENFECTAEGIIVYKTFGDCYAPPKNWDIKPRSVITENVNHNRCNLCGSGINVATYEWVKRNCAGNIWKLLIRWEWLLDVCVPYNTNGKIRCGKAELVEIVER